MPKSGKRARGKRGGKKHKKKAPSYIIPRERLSEQEASVAHEHNLFGFHTDIQEDNPIHEIKTLKPEFVFIDAHDTILHDLGKELCVGSKEERKSKACDKDGSDIEVPAYAISMNDFTKSIKLMLEFMKTLPDNVVVYANPRHTPIFLGYLQLTGLRNDTLNRINLLLFSHKGEDYQYVQDGQTGASLRRNITDRLVIGTPISTDEKIECGICMDDIARAVDNSNISNLLGDNNSITSCASCGAPACGKCINKHLLTLMDVKFLKRRNAATCKTEREVSLHKPENGTCPFCRGGWWSAVEKNHVPQTFLDLCQEWIKTGDIKKKESYFDIAMRNNKETEEELI